MRIFVLMTMITSDIKYASVYTFKLLVCDKGVGTDTRDRYCISTERKQNTTRKPKIRSYLNKHEYKRIKFKYLSYSNKSKWDKSHFLKRNWLVHWEEIKETINPKNMLYTRWYLRHYNS